ncbi:MAG: hypothetical protein R2786_08180 [Flavobacteriaceae bacterium]
MNQLYEYDFGIIEVHDFYVKAVISEGVTIEKEISTLIISIANKHFPKKPFGYITHRVHSYSVNPIVYLEVAEIENLVGFAIVSENPSKLENSNFEKFFIKKSTKAFTTLDKAIQWVKELVEKKIDVS